MITMKFRIYWLSAECGAGWSKRVKHIGDVGRVHSFLRNATQVSLSEYLKPWKSYDNYDIPTNRNLQIPKGNTDYLLGFNFTIYCFFLSLIYSSD